MARLEANLEVKTGNGNDYSCTMSDQFTEVVTTTQTVGNSDTYTQIAAFGTASSIGGTPGARLAGAKLVVVKNNSDVSVELEFAVCDWKDDSNVDQANSVDLGPDSATTTRQFSYLLGANEYMILPNQWMVSYAEGHSAGNAKTIDSKSGYAVNAGKLYGDSATNLGAKVENTETQVTVVDSDVFRVGDLIQLGTTTGTTATNIEIMRVVSIDSATVMQVERQLYGSILGDGDAQSTGHVSGADVWLPWFNTQNNYNKFHQDANALGYVHTNETGRYTAQNLFGYGRSLTYPTGIVKGSFAMKFYNAGYQELGLSGITPSTNTGLAASTTYQFNITVDDGSAFVDLAFTTDATNLNFGGNNGVISKIQAALDAQYYTAGNLFEKRVSVGIVNGDVRFTSANRTSLSAILLAAPGSGTTPFGVGRLTAIGSVEGAVAAKLPDDTVFDKQNYIESKNKSAFAYDDGKGNLLGAASGTLNYETGAIDIQGPANAEFVVSFNYDSAHSGGISSTTDEQNTLKTLKARSLNSKIDAQIEILGFV
jgi:hypothetical protein|tara:strand:+ start:1914 stop:3530 length:1617 start_codon:yes stop_codon:yes gene_type:complete